MAAVPGCQEEKRILSRAQDEAKYLLDVRAKIGEMMAQVPKATNGGANQYQANVRGSDKSKTKELADSGLTRQRASEYERMAAHPEIVEQKQQRELEITTVAAQCRLGELTAGMEKRQGKRNDITSAEPWQKSLQLEQSGISHQRASEYERMAAHPDVVERYIEEHGYKRPDGSGRNIWEAAGDPGQL